MSKQVNIVEVKDKEIFEESYNSELILSENQNNSKIKPYVNNEFSKINSYDKQNVSIQQTVQHINIETQNNAPVVNNIQNGDNYVTNNINNNVLIKDNTFFNTVILETWNKTKPQSKMDYILPTPNMDIKGQLSENKALQNFKAQTENLKLEYFGQREEAFEEAYERKGLNEKKFTKLKNMFKRESTFFRYSFYFGFLLLLIGIFFEHFIMIGSSFVFMLFVSGFLFTRSFRLWQMENRYLGSGKEFFLSEGFSFLYKHPEKSNLKEKVVKEEKNEKEIINTV